MSVRSSVEEFERALRVIPGGVNSPVRAFGGVAGRPLFIRRGEGAFVETEDGARLIDFVASYGPLINGHSHPEIVAAISDALSRGTAFGAPTVMETELAELVCERVPNVEMIRMTSSGTESVMSAIRLARAVTGRDNILKFSGCYHGHSDGLLVSAGSGALTFGVPNSPGIPKSFTDHTLVCNYNDISAVQQLFMTFGDSLAAVIVEPIAGNMSCVPPSLEFHRVLRDLCTKHGVLLIWDEVMTGFRVGAAGSQNLYPIAADLFTFGKVIGGGLPVGAIGGSADLMRNFAPAGKVYQAGTLSGNPVAVAAGIANLRLTEQDNFYPRLAALTARFADGLRREAKQAGIDLVVNSVCGMLGIFFTSAAKVERFDAVMACDTDRFTRFFYSMLEDGIYLPPSPYEAWFISSAHTEEIIDSAIAAAGRAFQKL
ncbi:MAG: glutamate-1-semialdehyde 2,1-aminomutase [Cardiobacteriaceae bacterium]|nr:glutamate-1-semialdehyde 2,1-aminomutase [Cardiobacteriaceae bacterium]